MTQCSTPELLAYIESAYTAMSTDSQPKVSAFFHSETDHKLTQVEVPQYVSTVTMSAIPTSQPSVEFTQSET